MPSITLYTYKFPLAYGESMTMMTPYNYYGVIGWERVNAKLAPMPKESAHFVIACKKVNRVNTAITYS